MDNTSDKIDPAEVETLRLIAAAGDVRLRAYAPYSKYLVGAAVLGEDGVIYGGCNMENASYGLCICAERVAMAAAIAAGCAKPAAIALVSADGAAPCGACRQVLVEFNPEMQVIIATAQGTGETYRVTSAAELLPDFFKL